MCPCFPLQYESPFKRLKLAQDPALTQLTLPFSCSWGSLLAVHSLALPHALLSAPLHSQRADFNFVVDRPKSTTFSSVVVSYPGDNLDHRMFLPLGSELERGTIERALRGYKIGICLPICHNDRQISKTRSCKADICKFATFYIQK